MSEKISATTDAEGYFEQHTPDNVGITIMKDGYYTTRKFWSHEDITNDPIMVTLQPENVRVPMYRGTIKLRDPEITAFGIRFVQVETVSENVALVRSKGGADLWVELYRNEDGNSGSGPVDNNAVWHARVTGRNGWNLLPELDEMSEMREAPMDAAYEQVLEFSFKEFPGKIYLRQGEGDSARYGKLTTILRHDANKYMTAHVCAMGYAVQASPVGNNSLNPVQEVSRR